MPWDVVQDDETFKWCVIDIENKKVVDCFDNQDDAEKLGAALYARSRALHEFSFLYAVERGWLGDLFQKYKNIFFPKRAIKERWVLGNGGTSGQNCAKCREFAAMGDKPLGFFPAQRMESTYCGPDCSCHFEYSDGKSYDLERIQHWEEWENWNSHMNRSNDLTDDEASFILASQLAEPHKTFFIHRTQNDRWRWFAWPACTAFINRDHEIDSKALFDKFIDHIERTQEWPYLTFWHLGEKFKLGEADFVARENVAYIVSGLFDQTKIAREVIKGLQVSEPHYWGTSIRYKPIGKPYFIVDRGRTIPVYYDGIHKEVSLLPEQAASSILTAFPIIKEQSI